jgi:DNA replication protein DnaC
MPLSDIKIKNLKAEEKPYKVSDFEGLFILIKVSGSKSWRFKYRVDGKEKLLVIGDYPAHSLAQARKARDAAKALLAQGIDPNEATVRQLHRGEFIENAENVVLIGGPGTGKSHVATAIGVQAAARQTS